MDKILYYDFSCKASEFEKHNQLYNVIKALNDWLKRYCYCKYVDYVEFKYDNGYFVFWYKQRYIAIASNIQECFVVVRTFENMMEIF